MLIFKLKKMKDIKSISFDIQNNSKKSVRITGAELLDGTYSESVNISSRQIVKMTDHDQLIGTEHTAREIILEDGVIELVRLQCSTPDDIFSGDVVSGIGATTEDSGVEYSLKLFSKNQLGQKTILDIWCKKIGSNPFLPKGTTFRQIEIEVNSKAKFRVTFFTPEN